MPVAPEFAFEAVIIGAGQAGLAAAYYLRQRGVSLVLLDERTALGDVWASRFDALTLFSPAWASGLPGRAWPGSPLRYPTKDEAASYLRDYATHFQLPVHLGQRVVHAAAASGGYQVETAAGRRYRSRLLLICTGAYNAPRLPAFATALASTVVQLHSQQYQRPAQLPGTGSVAVVGSGNSALQIAADLAASGRAVYAAYDEATPALPNNTAMWVLLTVTGLPRLSRHSLLGRRMLGRPDPVVSADLARLRTFPNVTFIGRALGVAAGGTAIQGRQAVSRPLQGVVWATGYGPAFSWLNVPGVLDAAGAPCHHRGLTQHPGLAFLGLPWLNSRSSALMGGVGADARYVVTQLLKTP